jgi:hypothetical protein
MGKADGVYIANAAALDPNVGLNAQISTVSSDTVNAVGATAVDVKSGLVAGILVSSTTTEAGTTNTAAAQSYNAATGLGTSIAIGQTIAQTIVPAIASSSTETEASTTTGQVFGDNGLFGKFGLPSLDKAVVGVVETAQGIQAGIFAADGATPLAIATTTNPALSSSSAITDALSPTNLITPTLPSGWTPFQSVWGTSSKVTTLTAVTEDGVSVVEAVMKSMSVHTSTGETENSCAEAEEFQGKLFDMGGNLIGEAFEKTLTANSKSSSAGLTSESKSSASESGAMVYLPTGAVYSTISRSLETGLTNVVNGTTTQSAGSSAKQNETLITLGSTPIYQTKLNTIGSGVSTAGVIVTGEGAAAGLNAAGAGAIEASITAANETAIVDAYFDALGAGTFSTAINSAGEAVANGAGAGAVDTGATILFPQEEGVVGLNAGLQASGSGTLNASSAGTQVSGFGTAKGAASVIAILPEVSEAIAASTATALGTSTGGAVTTSQAQALSASLPLDQVLTWKIKVENADGTSTTQEYKATMRQMMTESPDMTSWLNSLLAPLQQATQSTPAIASVPELIPTLAATTIAAPDAAAPTPDAAADPTEAVTNPADLLALLAQVSGVDISNLDDSEAEGTIEALLDQLNLPSDALSNLNLGGVQDTLKALTLALAAEVGNQEVGFDVTSPGDAPAVPFTDSAQRILSDLKTLSDSLNDFEAPTPPPIDPGTGSGGGSTGGQTGGSTGGQTGGQTGGSTGGQTGGQTGGGTTNPVQSENPVPSTNTGLQEKTPVTIQPVNKVTADPITGLEPNTPVVGKTMRGNRRSNALSGTKDNDILKGRGGNDKLFGLGGDDMLDGGSGNNRLNGGADADTFVLNTGKGKDVVLDFEVAKDKLMLSGGLQFSELIITQVGGRTQVSVGDDLLAILRNTNANSLTSTNFAQV